jgi:membrane-bound ClpP family serine protease
MEQTKHNGKALASMVLGIIGLGAWFIPLFGAPITITGLILGIYGLKSSSRGMAIAGVVMCIIGLVATIVNGSVGAYMGCTGQLFK